MSRLRLILLGLLLLLLLGVGGLALLAGSAPGLRVVVAQLVPRLPGEVSVVAVEGRLVGPLTLSGLSWSDGQTRVQLERLELDWRPGRLGRRELDVQRLRLRGLRVELPGPSAPATEPAGLPEALPTLELPLVLRLQRLSVEGIELWREDQAVLALDRVDADARLATGQLQIDRLEIRQGEGRLHLAGSVDSRRDWTSELELELDAQAGDLPLKLVLGVDGDLRRLEARAELDEPVQARVRLRLLEVLQRPQWELGVEIPEIRPTRFGSALPDLPLGLELAARGDLGRLNAEADARIGGREYRLEALELALEDRQLELARLRIRDRETDGLLELSGRADAGVEPAELAASARFEALTVPPGLRFAGSRADGTLDLEGTLDDFAFRLDSRLHVEQTPLALQARGRGSHRGLDFEALTLRVAGGQATLRGNLGWEPRVEWALTLEGQGFDPGLLLPEWPGHIDADLDTEGHLSEAGVHARLEVRQLHGQLQGRRFSISGRVDSHPERLVDGALEVELGQSRASIAGDWAREASARVQLERLVLADLLDGADGELRGLVRLSGTAGRLRASGELQAAGLGYDGHRLAAADLLLDLPLDHDGPVEFALRAEALQGGGRELGQLVLVLDGRRGAHRLDARLHGPLLELSSELVGGFDGQSWTGRVERLEFGSAYSGRWGLGDPAVLRLGPGRVLLERLCLASGPARACANLDHDAAATRAALSIETLALAELLALSGIQSLPGGTPLAVDGELDARLDLRRNGRVLSGDGQLRVQRSELRLGGGEDEPGERLLFEAVELALEAGADRLQLLGSASIDGEPGLELRLIVLDPQAAPEQRVLDGDVRLSLGDLAWLAALPLGIEELDGSLGLDLRLSGTQAEPQPSVDLRLAGVAFAVPEQGLLLRDGELALRFDGQDDGRLDGRIRSGSGELRLSGEFGFDDEGRPRLRAALDGEDFVAMDTRMVRAVVAPELRAELAGERLRLRGSVGVPSALVDLSRLEGAVRPSRDVVVLRDDDEGAAAGIQVDSDLNLRLGRDVRLIGFGFDGSVTGTLRIRDRPGRPTTGTGNLDVTGSYRAYGQNLSIERGRLLFSASPLEDPGLDVRAIRRVDEVTVGIQVRGRASQPVLEVFSEPPRDQADALSYLVLGRPMAQVARGEGAGLSAAAQAIGVGGGNLLAQSIGGRFGLDEVGIEESAALGGAAFMVGKYLSPRLYIGYGMSLVGSSDLIRLRYLLSERWSVEAEIAEETRGIFNWRLER